MKSNAVKIGLAIVLSAVLLWLFGRSIDWKDVPAQVVDVNLPLFLLVIPLSVLQFVTRAARWHILVAREKINVRFRNLVAANFIGFTITDIFPGRVGELVRPIYLARKESLRVGFTVGTVVVERIFDMFTNCILLGLFLLARPLFAGSWPVGAEAGKHLKFWGTVGVALGGGILAVTLLLYFFHEPLARVFGRLLKPLPEKPRRALRRVFDEFVKGLTFFRTGGQLVFYAVLSLLVWLGIVLFYWVFFAAYRVHLPFFMVIPYVFLTAVGASIPTPGMVGGFHYFSKLAMVLLFHLAADRAAGLTVVVHALQIAVTCLIGYAILAREGLTLLQLKKMGESEPR